MLLPLSGATSHSSGSQAAHTPCKPRLRHANPSCAAPRRSPTEAAHPNYSNCLPPRHPIPRCHTHSSQASTVRAHSTPHAQSCAQNPAAHSPLQPLLRILHRSQTSVTATLQNLVARSKHSPCLCRLSCSIVLPLARPPHKSPILFMLNTSLEH